jgi:lysophospholipase L1-like esterase
MMTARTKIILGVVTTVLVIVAVLFTVLAFAYLKNMRSQAAFQSDPLALEFLERRLEMVDGPFLLLGDSRVAQWSPIPVIDGVPIHTVGAGGITAVQLAYAIPNLEANLEGETVIVQVGINDLKTLGFTDVSRKELVERTIGALQEIYARLTDAGARVVFTTMIPPGPVGIARMPFWTDEINIAVVEVNNRIKDGTIAKDSAIVDFTGILGSPEEIESRYATDTLHLNSSAYERLSEAIEEALGQPERGDP